MIDPEPEENALIDEFFGGAEKTVYPDDFRGALWP